MYDRRSQAEEVILVYIECGTKHFLKKVRNITYFRIIELLWPDICFKMNCDPLKTNQDKAYKYNNIYNLDRTNTEF